MHTHRSKAEGKSQAELEADFWKRVRHFRWIFQICPHLAWVGVCNSLPMHTLKPGSDIDLFIVSQPGRLFTARLWITLLTTLLGVRRHGAKTHKRFCLSFFVESGHEDLSPIAIKDDIYLARWVQTLHPIAGEWSGYKRFLEKNKEWTRALVGDLTPQAEAFRPRSPLQRIIQTLLGLPTLPFEGLLKGWQLKRARHKASQLKDRRGTLITEHELKFHDQDRREELRAEWKGTSA